MADETPIMATESESLHYPTMELLMRHGIAPKTAKYVAMNELRYWPLDYLQKVFSMIKRPARNYSPFKRVEDFRIRREILDSETNSNGFSDSTNKQSTFVRNERGKESSEFGKYFRLAWPSLLNTNRFSDVWLRAPRELIVQSVLEGAALCVNENGDFALRKQGYIALSHAWSEGLQRDENEDGVSKSKINLIFSSLRRQCIEVDWIWMDVIAVPNSTTELTSLEDDILKVKVINTLADIYQQADGIAIFDSLAWQLQSNNLVHIAIVLVCGIWSSRVWTFQEIKLAKRAFIITSGPRGVQAPEWSGIVDFLAHAMEEKPDLYRSLWLFYVVSYDKSKLSIRDLVGRCQMRETGNDVDYARAFFPTLGLKWKQGMTREQGMQEIYLSQRWEATRTMFYYGCPRMSIRPGWMPSTLVGLEGEVSHGLEYESRGVRGSLYLAQISTIPNRFQNQGRWVFNCVTGKSNVQCVIHETERDTATERIDSALESQTLYLIRPQESDLNENSKYAKVGLFAIRALVSERDGFECAILCAVLIMSRDPFPMSQTEILIRHGSIYDSIDLENELRYIWHNQKETSIPIGENIETGEQKIHRAVRNNDVAMVRSLLENGADPHAFDGTGMSAIHIAACRGYENVFEYILSRPNIDLNLPSGGYGKDTPIFFAAEYNQPYIIQILVKNGVNLDFRKENGYTALMIAALEGSLEAAETLLDLGADPNVNGFGICRETPLKLACGRGHPAERRLALVQTLLDRGANPNGILKDKEEKLHGKNTTAEVEVNGEEPYIWSALSEAVQWSNSDVVELLLLRGANPNIVGTGDSFLPLRIAVNHVNSATVSMLLRYNASCDIQFENGSNILHCAAQCPDFEIVSMILDRLEDKAKIQLLNAKLTQSGETPAMIAKKSGTKIVRKMLVEAYNEAQKRLSAG